MWKPVAEFPDYLVSDDGRIKSLRPRNYGAILEGTVRIRGYTVFMLRKPGSTKTHPKLLHRLMAIAFLPNPECFTDVAHNDGNPKNRDISNLRWSTHRDNQMDMRSHGTMKDGEKCITCKLKESQVREIIRRCGNGESQKHLAAEFGVSKQQICKIVHGQRWASLRSLNGLVST